VSLPNLPIVVVSRDDASGTTYVWSDFLSKVNGDWKRKHGPTTDLQSLAGVRARGNNGVATAVSRQVGAIGYLELSFAVENNLSVAHVKNKEGKFVAPSPDGVTAAAAATQGIPDDLRFSLTDAPGEKSYPIASAAWAVLYLNQSDRAAGRDLVDFLRWATHEGQAFASELKYSPLPPEIVRRSNERLDHVRLK
jgi:phosphate transport system substrate-binding protein